MVENQEQGDIFEMQGDEDIAMEFIQGKGEILAETQGHAEVVEVQEQEDEQMKGETDTNEQEGQKEKKKQATKRRKRFPAPPLQKRSSRSNTFLPAGRKDIDAKIPLGL